MLDNDASNNNSCNPQKLPLGDLKLALSGQDGVRRHVPALDEHWVRREKPFGSYICLMGSYGHLKSGAALEEWTFAANNCRQDMEFLLSLSQHEFWSYMVYEESAMAAIVTFLQRANPYYRQTEASQDKELEQANLLYGQLLDLVVRLVMRLCTGKESDSEWISPQQHSSLLYSNYLISVPMLFDLLIAVGDAEPTNVELLREIFEKVLRLQPEYRKDLKEALAFYESAFLSMQIQVENEGCEGAGGGAPLDADLETPYDDVVLFAMDCAYTLRLLLLLCPELVETIEQLRLGQSIANFYDMTVPMLYKNIYMVNPGASSLRWLNETRQQFLFVFRRIVSLQMETGRGQQLVELLQECLSAQTFVVDYQRQFPLEHDMELLLQRCPNIKNYKVDFVIAGYQKALSSCPGGIMADDMVSNLDTEEEDEYEDEDSSRTSPQSGTTANGATRDIDLEVTAVLDVLPDLGTGFIRRLLTRYENSEQAIAAILDDNLPPDLAQMDRREVFVPPDPQDKLQRQTGVRHFNVHDGDRYDVLTRDQPECIIKQGKGLPGAPRNAEQLLDDKSDMKQLKERYQQYAMVEETPLESGEYDDEYDDSYEALNEGQAPPVSLLRARLQGAASNSAYEAQDQVEDDDEESSNSGSDTETARRNNKDFCENPEVIRARYQQRQMAKYGQKSGGGGGGGGGSGSGGGAGQQSNPSVVGAPKGQGQSQQTQRNRGQKEAHKSSRANHNRKAGAAFKRSKGMMG
ncbi:activating signal cointegrator 1 complex subunit 2 [Drosophila subpulchrella]|uniref:activating signal cointegrator 1 complex subunit 2 n=1 Tax=Drosophila subpulchrella TaxID=1486046 RepID=UPI0018A19E97|nr:activating signal cointegrator 1 complex subunit 2 [Drosophila subpulchrella]